MNFTFPRRFFMPYITGPACILPEECGDITFPVTVPACSCTVAPGGINELYFIPCTETFSEANVTSSTWWGDMVTAGTLGRSGIGLGSIGKKSSKSDRVGSCRTEQITGLTWALKYQLKCFDKTSARSTQAKLNALLLHSDHFLLAARMCDGDNDVLPVGVFDVTDLNWTLPDNFEDNQVVEIELSWKEFGIPTPVTVAGLSAVVPKLT